MPKVLRSSLRFVVAVGNPAVAGLGGVCLVCRPTLLAGARVGGTSGAGVSGGESLLPG